MFIPGRDDGSRKGENGKVGAIAGSGRYTGAPALCGQAAMRAGADLVRILTSEKTRDVVAGFSKDLIVEGYGGDFLTAGKPQRSGGSRGVERCGCGRFGTRRARP